MFRFDAGVDETEPTLIADGAMQDCTGAEYRVGEQGVFVARGRDLYGTISGVTGIGLYEAGFDSAAYILAHAGASYWAAAVGSSFTFSAFVGVSSTALPVVGAHYSNRHYLANGADNLRVELAASGVTAFTIGMSRSTLVAGVSVLGDSGSMSASTGLVYWATEYDSVRGIESMTGSSVSTGAFTSKNGTVVYVTGTSVNPRADTLRWYRSTDGGGFPDGGLIGETPIGTTSFTDTLAETGSLSVPQYGLVSIGGLDQERDEPPVAMSIIFGPFQDSLIGVPVSDPRTPRFTPAGLPDSWPSGYAIPFNTQRRDEVVAGVVLPGRIGLFCNDSVHAVYRLPRDSDSVFAAGEAEDVITDARGAVSRRGVIAITPIGGQAFALFISRDGIWLTDLVPTSSPVPVTDKIAWETRVDTSNLSSARLVDDPINRRAVFIHRRAEDTTHSTGVWYLDYQDFANRGIRVTFADHGPLEDAITFPATNGRRQMASIDSRSANGQVYVESIQDVDDSQLVDASGSVKFRVRSKEFMPGGPRVSVSLGKATWMHDAGPFHVEHRFYHDRRDDNPQMKLLPDADSRNASDVELARNVNSFSLELLSVGTVSYGVHWFDVEAEDAAASGGRGGA